MIEGRGGGGKGAERRRKRRCKKLSSLNTTTSICLAIKRFYGRRVEDSSPSFRLELFSTHDQRSILAAPRSNRRFFFIFNFSILSVLPFHFSFFLSSSSSSSFFEYIFSNIRDSKSRSIDSNGPTRLIFRRAQQMKRTLADSRGFNFPPVIAIYNKTRGL